MAPTLTSNSFLLTTPPHSKHNVKIPTFHRVFAKRSAASPEGNKADGSPNNLNPFSFNFGKAPDMMSLIPVVSNPGSGLSFPRRKDPGTVFVAGATGLAGIRIAQMLLRQGFSVRAGVPELVAAQELARFAAEYKIISKEESKRLNAVESTFEDAEAIAKAIGNASKVVVTIGPSENGPNSEVTTSDALQIIQAAQLSGVGHVAIIYNGNTNASTYNVLDGLTSFFNNLFAQSQPLSISEFLQQVIETDVRYTLIKTSLTDDFSPESSYNLVVSAEGSISNTNTGANDYKVAMSRIASVVAEVFSNTEIAENKVVEVFTDPSAPLKSVDELFSAIPEDTRRKVYAETIAKEKEEEAKVAAAAAREAADEANKLAEEVKKISEKETKATEEAPVKAEVPGGASVENLLSRAKDISSGLSWDKFSTQFASAVQTTNQNVQVATVRGQAKARSLTGQKAVVKKQPAPKPKSPALKPKEQPKPKAKAEDEAESKAEVRKLFGGLFKQETIYVDED